MASAKKVFFWGCLGCGGFMALIVLLVIGAGAFIGYKAIQFGGEVGKEYTELSTNYEQLDQEFAFTEPENQLMAEKRFDEFLQIRASAIKFAKQYEQEFEKLGDDIGATFEKGGITSAFTGAGKIGEIIKAAVTLPATIGGEHIRLLKEAQMSPDEYRWFTQEVLGTLLKAEGDSSSDAEQMWTSYVEAFEQGRDQFQGMNVNTGKVQFHGSDIQLDHLLKKLNDVLYIEDNAALITKNSEKFIIDGKAAMLDYMAVHLDEMLVQFGAHVEYGKTDSTE